MKQLGRLTPVSQAPCIQTYQLDSHFSAPKHILSVVSSAAFVVAVASAFSPGHPAFYILISTAFHPSGQLRGSWVFSDPTTFLGAASLACGSGLPSMTRIE